MPRQKHGAYFVYVNIKALLPLSLWYFRSGLSVEGKVQCVHKGTRAREGIAIARSEKDTLELYLWIFLRLPVIRPNSYLNLANWLFNPCLRRNIIKWIDIGTIKRLISHILLTQKKKKRKRKTIKSYKPVQCLNLIGN